MTFFSTIDDDYREAFYSIIECVVKPLASAMGI